MSKHVVDTAKMLRLCQLGVRSGEPDVIAAAESAMSALVLHLRHEQALLPSDVKPAIKTLREYATRCKVNNTSKQSAN